VINNIIQHSPAHGSITPPVYMVLAQAMNTNKGFNAFLHAELNIQFKAMFKDWTDFLCLEKSHYVLNDGELR
jgi:phosphatidylserine decarboxylase